MPAPTWSLDKLVPAEMEQALGYFAALCAATLLGSLRKAPRGPSAYFRLAAGMAVVALGPGPVCPPLPANPPPEPVTL